MPRDVIKVSTLAGGASSNERIMYCKFYDCIVGSRNRRDQDKCKIIMHPTKKPFELTDK